jgi:hypothetical protein
MSTVDTARTNLRETLVTHYMDRETLLDIRVVLDELDRLAAPPVDEEREALAQVLDQHWFHAWRCSCGWVHPQYGAKTLDPGYLRVHIATAILAAGFRRRGPITDTQVAAVEKVIRSVYGTQVESTEAVARAALEAAGDAS